MPATVYEFATVRLPRQPTSVFVETSFLTWARVGNAPRCRDRRMTASAQFLDRLSAHATLDLWTTPMVFEEAVFGLLKNRISVAARRAEIEWQGWRDLKKNHRAQFETFFGMYAQAIATELHDFLNKHQVTVRLPRHPWRGSGEFGRRFLIYMRWLLGTYTIEPADALHVACAQWGRAYAVVTNDLDIQLVDGLRVMAYRRR